MKNFDLIAEAIKLVATGDNDTAIARLEQFARLNTPKVGKGNKVNIWDWIGDKYCPYANLKGVYYDTECGVTVATDTYVMVVSKPDAEFDGQQRIMDKKGDVIKGKYPLYNRVIPKTDGRIVLDVDYDKIADMLTKERSEKKLYGREYMAFNVGNKEYPFYIKPKYCKLLLTLPMDGKFYYSDDTYSPLLYVSEDYTALFMPVSVMPDYVGQDMIQRLPV